MHSDVFEFENEDGAVEAVRYIITSPAWRGYFKPKIEESITAAMQMLLHPGTARHNEMPDDYLRARVHVLNELLTFGVAEIQEWDREKATREAADLYQEDVHERAEVGRIGPR